jgi:hypothetical protein
MLTRGKRAPQQAGGLCRCSKIMSPPNCNETLSPCQDRLVSEPRLAGATNLAEANPCCGSFAPVTTIALPFLRFAFPATVQLATSAACPAASISTAASACPIRERSAPITPSRWARMPSLCPRCQALAVMPEKPSKLSHQLDGIPAHLSRRPFTASPALAARRTRPTPPGTDHLGTETKKPAGPHLQPLRPPRFGGRYLNDNGGDKVWLQLIRHFRVATTQAGGLEGCGTTGRIHGWEWMSL